MHFYYENVLSYQRKYLSPQCFNCDWIRITKRSRCINGKETYLWVINCLEKSLFNCLPWHLRVLIGMSFLSYTVAYLEFNELFTLYSNLTMVGTVPLDQHY